MKTYFEKLKKILESAAAMRKSYRATLATIAAEKTVYSDEESYRRAEKAKADHRAYNQAAYEQAVELISQLQDAATAKQQQLPLSNPELMNALKIIELAGPSLEGDALRQINQTFVGDQAALRTLRSVYLTQGIKYDGGLDQLIYDPILAFEKLRERAYVSLVQEGSLNSLAFATSKIAALEGVEFPALVDPEGADLAMRGAAGLL